MTKNKILALILALSMLLTSIPIISLAANEVTLEAPSIPSCPATPETPDICNMLGKQKPETTEQFDNYILLNEITDVITEHVHSSTPFDRTYKHVKITESGTYYIESGNSQYRSFYITVGDNLNVYIESDGNYIGGLSVGDNTNIEFDYHGSMYEVILGSSGNFVWKDTLKAEDAQSQLGSVYTTGTNVYLDNINATIGTQESTYDYTKADDDFGQSTFVKPYTMGGYNFGEKASEFSVETVTEDLYNINPYDVVIKNSSVETVYDIGGQCQNIYIDNSSITCRRIGGDGGREAGFISIKDSNITTLNGIGPFQQYFGQLDNLDYLGLTRTGGFKDIYLNNNTITCDYQTRYLAGRRKEIYKNTASDIDEYNGIDVGFALIGGCTGQIIDNCYSQGNTIAITVPYYGENYENYVTVNNPSYGQIKVYGTLYNVEHGDPESRSNTDFTAIGLMQNLYSYNDTTDIKWLSTYCASSTAGTPESCSLITGYKGVVQADTIMFFNQSTMGLTFGNTAITAKSDEYVSWEYENHALHSQTINVLDSTLDLACMGTSIAGDETTIVNSEIYGYSNQGYDLNNPTAINCGLLDVGQARVCEDSTLEFFGTDSASPEFNAENPIITKKVNQTTSILPKSFSIQLPCDTVGKEWEDLVLFSIEDGKSASFQKHALLGGQLSDPNHSSFFNHHYGNCSYYASTRPAKYFNNQDVYVAQFNWKSAKQQPEWTDINSVSTLLGANAYGTLDSCFVSSIPSRYYLNDYIMTFNSESHYSEKTKDSMLITFTQKSKDNIPNGVVYLLPYSHKVENGGMLVYTDPLEGIENTDYQFWHTYSSIMPMDENLLDYPMYRISGFEGRLGVSYEEIGVVKSYSDIAQMQADKESGIKAVGYTIRTEKNPTTITYLPGDGTLYKYNVTDGTSTEVNQYVVNTSDDSEEIPLYYGDTLAETKRVYASFNALQKAIANSTGNVEEWYYVQAPSGLTFSHWEDENGNEFVQSAPIMGEYVVTAKYLDGNREISVRVITEDNSTEDFAYSYNEPFKTITDDEIQLLNWGYGTDSENYYGKSNSIYIPFTENSQEYLYVMGEKFIGTETDGATSVSGIPNLETANPIKKLKVGYGYTAVVVYANPSDFTGFIPSSVRQFGYIDSSFNQTTPTNAVVYYSYAGNAKAMILEDISSNNLSAQQVAEKYCHFCNDDLEPLSAEEQTATLIQLLADAGLSPMGIVPFEGMTPYTDENDWTVNPDNASEIIGYTGEYHTYIGIPATINGIEIKKVNPMALISSSNVDCGKALGFYVPATVTNITAGYADAIKTMDSSMDVAVAGIDDMSIFSLLPNAYVVVDENNPNYSSFKGSLYNKEKDYLYYLGGGLNETTVLPTVTSFSAYALTISSATYYSSIAVNKMTFLGTDPVSFNEVTITADGSTLYFGGFIGPDFDSGGKTISSINFICAENSPFHQAWITQVQNWLDESGITDTTAEEGAGFFLTLVDPETYDDPNLTSPGSETTEYSDTMYGVININQPFTNIYNTHDNNNYTFTLLNIPDRYVTPATTQYVINPSVSTESISIHLRLKRGTLNLITKDTQNTLNVADVVYEITNTDTGEIYTTAATDENGNSIFDNLTYGNYTVKQKTVPLGWKINEEIKNFSITEDGQIVDLTFNNEQDKNLYYVRIPEIVILDGATGTAEYSVSVKGTIKPTSIVSVLPDTSFLLSQKGKDNITANVKQSKTSWTKEELGEDSWSTTNGQITAVLTAGSWYGKWNFNIFVTD